MGKKTEVQYYLISNKEPIANANADYCIQSFSRSLLPTFDTPNHLDRTNNFVRQTDKDGKIKQYQQEERQSGNVWIDAKRAQVLKYHDRD